MGNKVTEACLGCTERRVGCHSGCEKYAAFREHIDSVNAAKRHENEAEGYFYEKDAKKRREKAKYHNRNKDRRVNGG